MSGLPITIDGIDCSGCTVMGLSITETLGSPSSCSLTIVDLRESGLPLRFDSLAEVVIGPLSATRYVANAAMHNGVLTTLEVTPAGEGAPAVAVRHTSVGATDTLGTLAVVGTDVDGGAINETITPVADSTVTGAVGFATVTSITGAGWTIAEGADRLSIGHAGDVLFRGQLTSDKRRGRGDGVYRAIEHSISAEGYQRLLPKSIVAPLLDWPRTVTSDNESSLINEQAYDTSVDGWGLSDGEIICALLADVGGTPPGYWEGPTLDVSDVQSFTAPGQTGSAFDPPLRFSDIGIDAAIVAMQSRIPAETMEPVNAVFWIDEQLCAHYRVPAMIGADLDFGEMTMGRPELAYPAPYKFGMAFTTDDMGWPTIMPTTLEETLDHGAVVGTLQVSGTTPWTVKTLTFGFSYGSGRESLSTSAQTITDSSLIGWWTLKDRMAPRVIVTVGVAAGYDGWRPGQVVAITDFDLYPSETCFVIRTVAANYVIPGGVGDGSFEYVLTCGDAERRSYVSEMKSNLLETQFDRAINIRVSTYDPAPNIGSYQLLDAQPISATGQPMLLPKRTVRWSMSIDGSDFVFPTDESFGWWFTGTWDGTPDDPGNTMINPDSGLAYVALARGAESLEGSYVDVKAELLDAI